MPKFMVTVDEETDAWLRKQGGGGLGSRQKANIVIINLVRNGYVSNNEGVRKIPDDWLPIEERKAQLQEQLEKEMTDEERKEKEKSMQLVVFQGDLVNELQEKFREMGLSQETRDTLLAMRKEQVKLAEANPPPMVSPPPPPPILKK